MISIRLKMSDDLLVRVRGVSKKFCRDLKKSLWYAARDVVAELRPLPRGWFVKNRPNRCQGEDIATSTERQAICSRIQIGLRREEFWAVDDISFELRRGQCLGLIGRNGAGKTTLLKLLNGLIKPDIGSITIRGRVGALIALGAGFNPILTARENILVNGSVLGLSKRQIASRIDEMIAFAEIHELIDMPIQNYSSGMQARLGFAVAAALQPDVLLVDEVLAVGDVRFRMKCYNKILELKSQGTAIILVSHNPLDLRRVCDDAILLSRGKAIMHGSLSAVLANYEALEAGARHTISNSSGVWIANVRLEGPYEVVSGNAACGANATIAVCIEIEADRCVDGTRVIVFIEESQRGVLASMSSVHQEVAWRLDEGKNWITLHLESLPLLEGFYSVSVAVYGPRIEDFFDQRNGACGFRVLEPEIDDFGFGLNGVLHLKHSWSFGMGTSSR